MLGLLTLSSSHPVTKAPPSQCRHLLPSPTILEAANDTGARQLDNRCDPHPEHKDRHRTMRALMCSVPHRVEIAGRRERIKDETKVPRRKNFKYEVKLYSASTSSKKKPTCGPVVEHMLGDVCGRVIRGESEVLRFPTDQNEAKVHLPRQQKQQQQFQPRSAQHRKAQTSNFYSRGWSETEGSEENPRHHHHHHHPSPLPLTSPDARRPWEGCEDTGIPL